MHRKVAAALAAVLALGLASCGGSEPVLTRAQLVRKVELACRQGLVQAQREMRANANDRSGVAFVGGVLADQQAVMEKVQHLNPPAAAKADFETFKHGVQQRIDLLKRVKAAGRAGVQRAMQGAQRQGEVVTRRVQAASRNLGVTGCI